jgi:nucleoside-diphosphate-sugar epimerase
MPATITISTAFISIFRNLSMIVAITGGTGFIGKKLVARLVEQGDTVRLLTRSSSKLPEMSSLMEIHKCDLATAEIKNLSLILDGVDVLYHCAAENNDISKMLATNMDGTRNLARAAVGKIGHWVQLSSVGVYGTHTCGEITEETQLAPVNIYEASKAAAENIVIETAAKNHFSYSILRPSKVYGPGMTNKVLFQLISLIDSRAFFFVGKPGASANYIYVDDVVEGLIRCGTMPAARNCVYNISDYRTIECFVSIISQVLSKPMPRLRVPENLARILARITAFIPNNPLTEQRVNAMVKSAIYSCEKLKAELGYQHRVCMEDGIRELVFYWKYNA